MNTHSFIWKIGNICAPFKQPDLMESLRDKEQGGGGGGDDLIHPPFRVSQKTNKIKYRLQAN